MNKDEIASYLVSLHTLMEAQSKGSHAIPSAILAAEYEKYWGLLKDTITKENENETRNRNHRNVDESRTNPSRDQPRRGSAAGDNG